MEDFISYEQFGNSAPLDDQPAEWVDAIMAVATAQKTVKNKIEREQEEKKAKKAREQQAKQKKGKRR